MKRRLENLIRLFFDFFRRLTLPNSHHIRSTPNDHEPCKERPGNCFNIDLNDRFPTSLVTDTKITPKLRTTNLGAPKSPSSHLGLYEITIDPIQLLKPKVSPDQTRPDPLTRPIHSKMPPENLRLCEIARSHLARTPRNVPPLTLKTHLKSNY